MRAGFLARKVQEGVGLYGVEAFHAAGVLGVEGTRGEERRGVARAQDNWSDKCGLGCSGTDAKHLGGSVAWSIEQADCSSQEQEERHSTNFWDKL